jgi:hypothetical protein
VKAFQGSFTYFDEYFGMDLIYFQKGFESLSPIIFWNWFNISQRVTPRMENTWLILARKNTRLI